MITKREAKPTTGVESSVEVVFEENAPLLKRFISRFFSNKQDIEDVVQEAFLRAYVAEQRRCISHPKPYLFRIAKNLALTKLEQKSRQIAFYIDDRGDGISDAGDHIDLEAEEKGYGEREELELLNVYCEAVAALPKKCRQVFLLRKVHGLGHREIAERMGLSVSSVEKYLLRGIVDCRAYMEKKGVLNDVRVTSAQRNGGGR
jgi:RNA polymerase sigma factor (sigma-70 family)